MRFDAPTVTHHTPRPTAGDGQAAESSTPAPPTSCLSNSAGYIRRCGEITRDAATALAHAHERGVVHRDIKPGNILLDRRGRVHIIDFGIARSFEDVTLTSTGALVGTPMYMSPEQVSGRIGLDHRTDIYSLGLVLYELLALARPISAPTLEGILRQIVTKPLPPLSWRNQSVPGPLEAVVHKATMKDPDDRYQSAEELARDLDNALAGRPVYAPAYRYRLDDREILERRPHGVGIIASLMYFVAILGMSFMLNFVSYYLKDRSIASFAAMFFMPLFFALLTLRLARSLFLGFRWKTYEVAVISFFVFGFALMGTLGFWLRNWVGGSVFVALASLLVVALVQHFRVSTREWFDFAETYRAAQSRLPTRLR